MDYSLHSRRRIRCCPAPAVGLVSSYFHATNHKILDCLTYYHCSSGLLAIKQPTKLKSTLTNFTSQEFERINLLNINFSRRFFLS